MEAHDALMLAILFYLVADKAEKNWIWTLNICASILMAIVAALGMIQKAIWLVS